jgi:hypothetical protein
MGVILPLADHLCEEEGRFFKLKTNMEGKTD